MIFAEKQTRGTMPLLLIITYTLLKLYSLGISQDVLNFSLAIDYCVIPVVFFHGDMDAVNY